MSAVKMAGIAVGLNKGHTVTKRATKATPARRRGALSQRIKKVSRSRDTTVTLAVLAYVCVGSHDFPDVARPG